MIYDILYKRKHHFKRRKLEKNLNVYCLWRYKSTSKSNMKNKHSIKCIRNLVLKRIRNFIYKYKYFYKFIVLTVEYNKNKWKNQILYINKNGVFSICVK